MSRIATKPFPFLPTLCVLWLAVHVVLFYHYGVRDLVDAERFDAKAAFLISHGALQEPSDLFYSLHVALLALFGKLFHTPLAILVFQSILSGLAMHPIYRAAAKAFATPLAGFMAGLIFLLWIDNLQWNLVAMTESLACSLMCFTLYAWVHFEGRLKDYVLLFTLILLNVLTRPTGFLALASTIVFLSFHHASLRFTTTGPSIVSVSELCVFLRHTFLPDNSRRVSVVFRIAGILILVAISLAGFNAILSLWDFTEQLARGNIVTYMDTLQGTPLYVESLHVNPSSIVPPPEGEGSLRKLVTFIVNNPGYILQAGLWKILYLVFAVRPYYSWMHNGFTLAWMMLMYGLFVRGAMCSGNVALKGAVYTVILLNLALIFITTIDWDNRFYVPMEPGIVFFAGGGAAALWQHWKNRTTTRV